MGPSPTYHPPKGEECETSVEHGLPLWAAPAVEYCSRRPRPSPMWGSRFVGERAVGPGVGEQKPLGKSPLRGNPSPESTYLPTFSLRISEAQRVAAPKKVCDARVAYHGATQNCICKLVGDPTLLWVGLLVLLWLLGIIGHIPGGL